MKLHKQPRQLILVWQCKCGRTIPKQGALLSGGPSYRYGYHIHCPRCSRIVAQYIDPKETRIRRVQI